MKCQDLEWSLDYSKMFLSQFWKHLSPARFKEKTRRIRYLSLIHMQTCTSSIYLHLKACFSHNGRVWGHVSPMKGNGMRMGWHTETRTYSNHPFIPQPHSTFTRLPTIMLSKKRKKKKTVKPEKVDSSSVDKRRWSASTTESERKWRGRESNSLWTCMVVV